MKELTLQIGDKVIDKKGKNIKSLSYQKIVEEALIEKGYKNVYQMDMWTITEFIDLYKKEFLDFVWEKIEKHEEDVKKEEERIKKIQEEILKKEKAQKLVTRWSNPSEFYKDNK